MSSLFSALTTAVAGLTAQSSAIGNISDNLANAQTTGYKSVGTDFEELVNASSATVNNPGGVTATPQYQNDVQGSITSSNTATSLAISGEGYFAVETASVNSLGEASFSGQTDYTREGDFTLDKNGYLVNGSGYYLTGYSINSDGTTNTASTSPIQVSALLDNPVATSTVAYDANLPSNAVSTSGAPFTSSTSTVQIYDALGNTYDMNYTWVKSPTTANTWNLNVDVADGDTTGSTDTDYTATIPFTFNDGSSSTNAGTISSISSAGSGTYTVGTNSGSGSPATVSISLQFPNSTAAQTVSLNFGTYNGSTGVTQFSDTNSAVSVTNFSQNGLASGSFNNLSIDNNGFVTLNYSNGTTKSIAQIPIVQFYAQDQLQRVTGGAYTSTLAAGTPRYSVPGSSGAGTIASSSLEQSNVDIATQFTQLVQAQQVYSANAKVVTTDDSLLQTTINMIQ